MLPARAVLPAVVLSLAVTTLGAQDRSVSILPQSPTVRIGPYHALLIAEQTYGDEKIPQLERPLSDARDLAEVLTARYQFDRTSVEVLVNPTRERIVASLFSLSEQLTESDNLLIFYAGHGFWDERTQQGYWLPSDARRSNPAQWISNADIVDALRRIKTRHTLLISDACFSGGILRTRDAFSDSNGAGILRLYDMPSRKAMTSGSKEVVADRSKFVEYLVKRLRDNNEPYLPASDVFASLRAAVMNNSTQTPQYGTIFNAGDEGGDFLFPLKPAPAPAAARPVSDVPVAPVPAHGAVWKNIGGRYWFYVEGQSRLSGLLDHWIGDDLLIFDSVAKRYYVFDGYKTRDDGQYRQARLVDAPEISLWRHIETTYWLFQDGKALTGLISTMIDDDLLVYDPASQQHYVLYDYKKYADGSLRPAAHVGAADRAVWRGLDDGYWLYVDGVRVSSVLSMRDGDNLEVCDNAQSKYYMLEEFQKRMDGRVRPARHVEAPDGAQWRQLGGNFWLFVNCTNIGQRTKSAYDGDSLFAYDPVSSKYYYFDDYKNRGDGKLRSAREIDAPDHVLWKHSGTTFWVVDEGQYAENMPNAWDGSALLAYAPTAKRYYLLEDYARLSDGQLRAAKSIAAPDTAVWKRVGTSFWLYVEGKLATGMTWAWDGDDLVVTDPASNRRFVLPNYRNRDDGVFRPATLVKSGDHELD